LTYSYYLEVVYEGETHHFGFTKTGGSDVLASATTSSLYISASKIGALRTRILLNPEILDSHALFVDEWIEKAALWLAMTKCRLSRYPEFAQGFSRSALSPSTDISALSSAVFWVGVNGASAQECTLTLAGLNSGSLIAAAMQVLIRALDDTDDIGFDEVVVAYDSSDGSGNEYYQITSGRYGERSRVDLAWNLGEKHVLQSTKLGYEWGGQQVLGSEGSEGFDSAICSLVEMKYRKLGAEGAQQAAESGGISFSEYETDPLIAGFLANNKRMPL